MQATLGNEAPVDGKKYRFDNSILCAVACFTWAAPLQEAGKRRHEDSPIQD
jgi:hypothetical protein